MCFPIMCMADEAKSFIVIRAKVSGFLLVIKSFSQNEQQHKLPCLYGVVIKDNGWGSLAELF